MHEKLLSPPVRGIAVAQDRLDDSTSEALNSKTADRSEGLQVRTALKAGAGYLNHNEVLRVRSTVKAGSGYLNHNENIRRRRA